MKRLAFATMVILTSIVSCTPTSASQPKIALVTATPRVATAIATATMSLAETPTNTSTPTIIPTATQTTASPVKAPMPAYGFVIGDKPFQFLGANVGKHWHDWSEAKDADLVKTAKDNGISVLQLDLPYGMERSLGDYQESELVKLDHLLDIASKNGIYVMIEFIHAYGIALSPDDPYYHPGGIEGLVKDERLREAFKKRMATIINRVNTVNGKKYSQDPTILAWVLVMEIVSAPQNYPEGPPKVTIPELSTWVEEMASYVKQLDANHLVTLNTHSGLAKVGDGWFNTLLVPSLDFVEVEDAEARFAGVTSEPVDFYLQVFTLKKPVVMMLSFTGGAIDQKKICNDYSWQAQTLKKVFEIYFEKMGVAAGFVIFYWASDVNAAYLDQCFAYSSSNKLMAQAFQDIAIQLGLRNLTMVPLQFVKLRH